ncbi:MAG TPA: hypothetical protein VN699_20700 [Pirellulales bacterium]|nr:hypothetical protein [Pirellulales bacterium]
MPQRTLVGLLLASLLGPATARAADRPFLETALQREIIGPKLSAVEAGDYAASRIPPIGEFKTSAEWQRHADLTRQAVLTNVVFRGEAAAWRDAETKVEWLETIAGGPGYRIKKLRYEALPGMWIPALLYEPETLSGKAPVMLNVNGHDGKGKAADYKQLRCINQAKRGILALNVEWFGMGQLAAADFSHARMNQLDLCGTSGIAPFYLAMKRGIDVLLSLEHADPSRVGVAGLSGGGWQTIFISSLDTRVTLCNPVAGYSPFSTRARERSDLGDSEQTPCDLAVFADYDRLTAMLAPRPALLTFNASDNCCFKADHALPPLLDAARPVYRLFAKEDYLRSHVNTDPGDHNFGLDNRQALYRMLGDHFFAGAARFDAAEIASDAEIKTKEELHVELPEQNAGFHTLAGRLIQTLPRSAALPEDKAAAEAWREPARKRLNDVVRAASYHVQALSTGGEEGEGAKATFWRLRVGDAWSVPAVEFSPADAKATVLLVADEGRASPAAVAEVERQLAARNRVVAVDPFYFGESKIESHGYLFALLVAWSASGRWAFKPANSPRSPAGSRPRMTSRRRSWPSDRVRACFRWSPPPWSRKPSPAWN